MRNSFVSVWITELCGPELWMAIITTGTGRFCYRMRTAIVSLKL